MPRIKSAIKRVEVAERNRERNRTWKSAVRSARNLVTAAIKVNDMGDADSAIRNAYSVIDSAVAKGVLHRNTAARRKSRLVASLKKAKNA